MGILSLLLWTPAIGVLLLALTPGQYTLLIRVISHVFSCIAFLLVCWLVGQYDQQNAELQFNEYFPLNPKLGSAYALGVDGLSMPMLILATLLTSLALSVSTAITTSIKGYHICLLLLEFGMLGVFLAQDWALFYIFWEVTLIPLFFLIGRWGGARRHAASLNFVLYTMGGSIFMLISLLAISQYDLEHNGSLMSSMHQAAQDMPRFEQVLVLLGFLIGFGVKMPIFPLHGWLPLAHVEAPSPISILLSGILLKMGSYGLLRAVVMLPEATELLQPLLIFLGLFGMLYGNLLAWWQHDLKAMIAYGSISHMGVVLLGIATLNETGMTGAVLQMSAHALVAGSLFLLVGLLYERTHTRNIQDYSCLLQPIPRFSLLMVFTLLIAMGLPGSINFIAELHILIGSFTVFSSVALKMALMCLFCLTALIGAAYCLRTLNLLFTGPNKPPMQTIKDLQPQEFAAASILVCTAILLGLLPNSLVDLSAATIARTSSHITQRIL